MLGRARRNNTQDSNLGVPPNENNESKGHCHRPNKKIKAHESEAEVKEESTHSPQEQKQTFTHRQQQRFHNRYKKSQGKEIQDQVEWERTREENRRSQIVRAAEWRVRTCFGFFPNLTLSIHKNARAVMGDMSPGCYFLKAANTTFHDLTKAKLLPPAAASLLGLSLKFIPTPHYSPSLFDVTPSFD